MLSDLCAGSLRGDACDTGRRSDGGPPLAGNQYPIHIDSDEVALILHNPIEITSLSPGDKELADAGKTGNP
jgi:hypothetical protein